MTNTNLIIVMGVSGCGKSSVAHAISDQLNYQFVEADDFHPQENKQHMASGKPLTDLMRKPWITALKKHLMQAAETDQSCVMSFSGLRREHRNQMRDLPFNSVFVHLRGEQALILERMNARSDHFMPPSLLDSQYSTLETSDDEPDVLDVDISQSLALVIGDTLALVRNTLKL